MSKHAYIVYYTNLSSLVNVLLSIKHK